MKTRHPLRVSHPSEFVDDEMQTRGWDIPRLALAMLGDDVNCDRHEYSVLILTVEMYFAVGPTHRHALMGDVLIGGFARAFGTSVDLWRNLEASWLAAWPPEPSPAPAKGVP